MKKKMGIMNTKMNDENYEKINIFTENYKRNIGNVQGFSIQFFV